MTIHLTLILFILLRTLLDHFRLPPPDNDMSVIVDYPELLGFIESRVYLENLYMPSCLDLLDTAGGKIIFFYPTYRVPRAGGPDT